METIRNYVNNSFAALPKTENVMKLKVDMLANMQEKFNELTASGTSENEAVGIVITEFGNINELTAELGLSSITADNNMLYLKKEEALLALRKYTASGILTGIGVFLCLISPISHLLFPFYYNYYNISIFAVIIAVAVALFIINGIVFKRNLQIFKKSKIIISDDCKEELTDKWNRFIYVYAVLIAVAVMLFILSFSVLGKYIMILVGIGVCFIICVSMRKSGFDALLGAKRSLRK